METILMVIITMLLGGAIAVLKIGFSEIVKGLESIDKRLESIEERNHRN